MRRQRVFGVCAAALLLAAALCAGGCGGGDETPAEDQAPAALVPAGADSAVATGDTIPGMVPAETAPDPAAESDPAGAGDGNPAADTTLQEAPGTESIAESPAGTPGGESGPAPNVVLPPHTTGGGYSVQLGSFQIRSYAETQADRVRSAGYEPVIEMADVAGVTWHRVLVRGIADRAAAEAVGEDLRSRLDVSYLIKRAD